MPFTPKDWEDAPSTDTPIDQAALEDLESRVTDYADSAAGDAVSGLATTAYVDDAVDSRAPLAGSVGFSDDPAARPDDFAVVIFRTATEPTVAEDGDIWIDV